MIVESHSVVDPDPNHHRLFLFPIITTHSLALCLTKHGFDYQVEALELVLADY